MMMSSTWLRREDGRNHHPEIRSLFLFFSPLLLFWFFFNATNQIETENEEERERDGHTIQFLFYVAHACVDQTRLICGSRTLERYFLSLTYTCWEEGGEDIDEEKTNEDKSLYIYKSMRILMNSFSLWKEKRLTKDSSQFSKQTNLWRC